MELIYFFLLLSLPTIFIACLLIAHKSPSCGRISISSTTEFGDML